MPLEMKIQEPPMEFKDGGQAIWDQGLTNNQDSYGFAIYRYASTWATLMEQALRDNPDAKLTDVAEECSRVADTEGITGFMYGAAVATLAYTWKHGEGLRQWHNAQYGAPSEATGVVNPAVIYI